MNHKRKRPARAKGEAQQNSPASKQELPTFKPTRLTDQACRITAYTVGPDLLVLEVHHAR